jgi:hypothetical protein
MGRITGLYYKGGLLLALAGLKCYYKYINISFILVLVLFILFHIIPYWKIYYYLRLFSLYKNIYFIVSILYCLWYYLYLFIWYFCYSFNFNAFNFTFLMFKSIYSYLSISNLFCLIFYIIIEFDLNK